MDCSGHICANIASVGFDARVGTDVHKYSNIPVIGGATGYVASLAVNFVKGLHRPMGQNLSFLFDSVGSL